MYYLDGQKLPLNKPFTDADGNQYPADWLSLSTPEQREAIGIIEVSEPETHYDRRFYWGPGLPKDLDVLKEAWKGKQDSTCYQTLLATDWYPARAHDSGRPVPAAVTTYRAEMRAVRAARIEAIDNTVDVEELRALVIGDSLTEWPELGEVVEAPPVDYRTFYGALLTSAVYQSIRTQAASDLPANVCCTELLAALGEAKAGLPQEAVVQGAIDSLFAIVTLTEGEVAELQELMDATGLGAIYTLPTA